MLYPILTSSRTVTDLSGIWDFKAAPGTAFSEKWYEKRLESPLKMPVPASYNDLTEDIYLRDHYGYVFYQRSFSVPEFIRATQRVVLRCDAVTHSAIVYINGLEVCRHKGGFLPFEAEINEYLTDGENLLTIAADNRIDYTTLPVGNPEDFWGSRGSSHKVQRRTNYPNFDFFNYCVCNGIMDYKLYPKTHSRTKYLLSRLAYRFLLSKQRDLIAAIRDEGTFRPMTPFDHTMALTKDFIGYGTKMGEGWLLSAEMLELCDSGVMNIVCTQPFGCLPNHICGKGMMKPIKEAIPGANIVAIDYDPGTSAVNQENRLKLMLSAAREAERMKNEG